LPCIGFNKLDGSNLRFEWSKKQGWHKFGTRRRLFDHTDPDFGSAIKIFKDTLASGLEDVFRDKLYKNAGRYIVFCEFVGPSSFAGWHDPDEPKELVLIDVSVHQRGMVLPRDFVKHFGHLRSAEVVYQGNFTKEFIQDVRNGEYPVKEGVVVKGVKGGKGVHGLWMSKVKTKAWLAKLKEKADTDLALQKMLSENTMEQSE